MKTKLFLLAFLLTASAVSLQAMIEEGNGREIQNSVTEDPRLRTVTVADGGTGFSSSQARESNNSLKVEETTPGQPKKIETLTPVEQPERSQRSLAYAQHLIQEAYHARDPDAPAWSKAAARVRLAKDGLIAF